MGIAVLASVPVVLIVAIFPAQIIRLMAGPAFGAAAGVMIALVAARAVSLIGLPCTSALTALGHPDRSMWANLLSSFAFLPLFPWLLTTFGLMGAGIQAVAQAVVASGLLALLVWRTSGR